MIKRVREKDGMKAGGGRGRWGSSQLLGWEGKVMMGSIDDGNVC